MSEDLLPLALNVPGSVKKGTVGKPLQGQDISLTEEGEILVRGPCVLRSYWAGEPAPPLDTDGFLHTGDFGYIDEDGYLVLRGRCRDLIKTSTGRRISPLEIENELLPLDFVEHAVVMGQSKHCVVALISLTDGCSEEKMPFYVEALHEAASTLQRYMQPAGYAFLPRPLTVEKDEITSNMKLRRDVIASAYKDAYDHLYHLISLQPAENMTTPASFWITETQT